MKSDWGNDSVSVQDCSDHTASALCPGLIFGFPGPAQHLMRFHTSASGVSFLLYTLCYESIQKPWSDDSLCCWRNNHSLCSPSSAWLLWPQCIPLMTPHPALTCSHPKLFQHPWIFDSFCATSQIRYGELLLVRMIQSGWKPPSRPVWFHSHYLSHPQISRRGCVCTYSVAQLLQPFGL